MRVLLVSPQGRFAGGIAKWTGHILRYYEQLSDKSIIIEHYDIARSSFINDDISFWPRLRLVWKDYRALLRGFRKVLKRSNYDVMHLTSSAGWGLVRDLYMIRLARQKGIKTIVHFRFGRIPELYQSNNREWKLLSRVVSKADRIIVIDKRSYEVLLQAGYNTISLLPNPLTPKVEEIIQSQPIIPRKPRTILFIGHCVATKGVYELVHACKTIPNIQLCLVGAIHEEVREDLKKISGGENWLTMEGEKPYEEVIREMLSCDVFVLPTYTEGFPNVILESMACGCAIVTTPVGAIPEMLDVDSDEPCGLCCEPKDVESLRRNIQYFLDRPNEAREYGNRAVKRVNEMYAMPKVWEQMVGIWREVWSPCKSY